MFEESRDNWQQAARASFDAFQLAETDRYTYRIDVPPLSFFFLDNRTFRTVSTRGAPGSSARADDLQRVDDWTNEVIQTDPASGLFEFQTAPMDSDTIEARYIAAGP